MYEKGQWITACMGNNAFSYEERKEIHEPKVFVPPLISGKILDACPGEHIVFEEWDGGTLHSMHGLQHFIYEESPESISYIIDNHNHAMAMWAHGKKHLGLKGPLPLFHVDQHRDMREPQQWYGGEISDLSAIEEYVMSSTNVGNFIHPARHAGMINDIHFLDKEDDFNSNHIVDGSIPAYKGIHLSRPYILDIDLDIFAEELAYLNFNNVIRTCVFLMRHAAIVTFATSPYFISQERALEWLQRIYEERIS